MGAIVPLEHRTNSDTGSGFKGAGDCSGLCNSFEEILDSKINANYKIRFESEVKDFELDPNKTPPEAEPAKQPPPERDKIRRDRGLRARTPRTPNGTAKGCARYLIVRISRSPDTGVEPCRLAATVGPKLCRRLSRDRRKLHICGRQDTGSSRRPITCGRYNMRARDCRCAGRRPSSRCSHSFPAHASHARSIKPP